MSPSRADGGVAAQPKTRIVVVDDDEQVAGLVRRFLERRGYAVRLATAARHALELVESWPADLLVTDLIMPGMDGFELLSTVRHRTNIPVIVMTGGGAVPKELLLPTAGHLGAALALAKPFSERQLLDAVESVRKPAEGIVDEPGTDARSG